MSKRLGMNFRVDPCWESFIRVKSEIGCFGASAAGVDIRAVRLVNVMGGRCRARWCGVGCPCCVRADLSSPFFLLDRFLINFFGIACIG